MSWDYDKLFAVGNIVGLRNVELNYVFVHQVDSEDINDMLREEDDIYPVDWDEYRNSRLASYGMEIEYIIRPNEDWSSVERLFIRDRDMPKPRPKLENGMFVRIIDEDEPFDDYGVVVGGKIIYHTGGWSSVVDDLPYIVAVWGDNVDCFDDCSIPRYAPIWEKK